MVIDSPGAEEMALPPAGLGKLLIKKRASRRTMRNPVLARFACPVQEFVVSGTPVRQAANDAFDKVEILRGELAERGFKSLCCGGCLLLGVGAVPIGGDHGLDFLLSHPEEMGDAFEGLWRRWPDACAGAATPCAV